jgi:transposase
MEHVLAGYPTAPMVVLVLDNVLIHRSKLVQAWLRAHPRMRLVYGARYSPHHNPVERIWGALKTSLANSPTLTIAGRMRQVHAFFRQRSNEQILATAAPHSSPWLPEGYGQDFRRAALGHRRQRQQAPPGLGAYPRLSFSWSSAICSSVLLAAFRVTSSSTQPRISISVSR